MTPDPRLLLPATRELLEGWCGPVVVHGRATVAWWDNGACSVWVEETPDGAGYWVIPEMVSPSFDLSRAECWMRVCWFLWNHVGVVSVSTYGQTPLVDSPSMTDDTHWMVTRRLQVGEMVVHEERADAPGVLFALGDDDADPLLSLAAVARQVLTPGGSVDPR